MKLGIMQPYLFPYIGYFQLINAVDEFVIYDDVQYIKNGWINRNTLLNGGKNPESTQFTFSVMHDSYERKINERYYSASFPIESKRFLKKLYYTYHTAPYYEKVITLIQEIFESDERSVSLFNANALKAVAQYLGLKTHFLFSSSLDIPHDLKSQNRVLWICHNLSAQKYINAIGGQSLYSKNDFENEGIELNFIQSRDIKYPQFCEIYVPNLSIIDVLMFQSPAEINILLNNYHLI